MSAMSGCFPKLSSYKNNFTILDSNVLESGEVEWTSTNNRQPKKVCSDEEVETLFDRMEKKRAAKKNELKSTNVKNTSEEPARSSTSAASSGSSSSTPIRPIYPEPEFRRIAPGIMDIANMLRIAKADYEVFINKKGRRKYKFDFIGKVYEKKEKKRKNKKVKSAE
ncbi:hypothetical protein WA026_016924 [Henosepilachna vigintioctopunctata]|uniref:Uncharacterized protein n=1 Tax=Henosepilachna vigintioctopunctata TaxID=420089 RepID=A0AAW1U8Z5_9CUCU